MIGNDAIFAANKVKQLSVIFILMAILNIIGAVVLSPSLGATGICISVFISYLVRTIGMDVIFQKEMKLDVYYFFRETFVNLSVPMALCLICGFVLEYAIPMTGWIGFIVKVGLFCGCYAIITYSLAMNSSERNLILTPVRKILKIK